MTELQVKLSRRQKREYFFWISFFLCLFFFFCPICPIFLFPPLLPHASHGITLMPFLLRSYQHICLEKLVFPSIFTPCFPKASLDPWTTLLVLFPFRPPGVKNQGVKLKTPDWPPSHINLQELPEPPGLIRKSLYCYSMGTNEEGTWCSGFHCSILALHEQVDL